MWSETELHRARTSEPPPTAQAGAATELAFYFRSTLTWCNGPSDVVLECSRRRAMLSPAPEPDPSQEEARTTG